MKIHTKKSLKAIQKLRLQQWIENNERLKAKRFTFKQILWNALKLK